MEQANYRPKLSLYHPDASGTGSALQLELVPAGNDHPNKDGYIVCTIAPQRKCKGNIPRFNWDEKVSVLLTHHDIGKMLEVLDEEEHDTDAAFGGGIVHVSQTAETRIRLARTSSATFPLRLSLCRCVHGHDGDAESLVDFTFTSSEVAAVFGAIRGSLVYLCFGLPRIIKPEGVGK
jgi:hypothetical protein